MERTDAIKQYLKNKHQGGENNQKGGLFEDFYAVYQIVSCIAKYKSSFDRVEFRLDPDYYSGGVFTVVAHDNSPENIYIQRAELNGQPLTASHIDFADIAAGGTLDLYMGPEPDTEWGVED